jgi:hypothetical protein
MRCVRHEVQNDLAQEPRVSASAERLVDQLLHLDALELLLGPPPHIPQDRDQVHLLDAAAPAYTREGADDFENAVDAVERRLHVIDRAA